MMPMQPNACGICVTYHATWIRQIPYLITTSLATLRQIPYLITTSLANMDQVDTLSCQNISWRRVIFPQDCGQFHCYLLHTLVDWLELLVFGTQKGMGVDNATHGGLQKLEAFCVVWFLFLEQRMHSWVILVQYLYFSIPFIEVKALLKFK